MSERTLEDRLMDAVLRAFGCDETGIVASPDLRIAIATALVLARREGVVSTLKYVPLGTTADSFGALPGNQTKAAAASLYPLPIHTRVLREEPDPEREGVYFRAGGTDGAIEASKHKVGWCVVPYRPTVARVALWHDLMQHPYNEREETVDPAEVLP